MDASHRKAQATRKENLETIKRRIQHQQQTALDLQGSLKDILRNEKATIAEKLEAAKMIMELDNIRC